MCGSGAWASGMMIRGTGRFERSEVQALGQFDEEMIGVAFEEFGIGVVAQLQNQLSQIGRDDSEGKIGCQDGFACILHCFLQVRQATVPSFLLHIAFGASQVALGKVESKRGIFTRVHDSPPA